MAAAFATVRAARQAVLHTVHIATAIQQLGHTRPSTHPPARNSSLSSNTACPLLTCCTCDLGLLTYRLNEHLPLSQLKLAFSFTLSAPAGPAHAAQQPSPALTCQNRRSMGPIVSS